MRAARASEPLLGKHISMEAAFQCTTCGACEYQCPVGIQHLPMIIGLRRGAVNTGKWEDEYGTKLFLNLERNGNALGFAHRASGTSSSRRTRCRSSTARRSTACGWAAWGPTIRRAARSCWRSSRCCGIWASPSACCGRRNARAIRRGGWATTCCSASWRESEPGRDPPQRGGEDAVDLPALRAHDRDGLEGVRGGSRDRAPQRTAGALCRAAAGSPTGNGAGWSFHDPCYLGRYRGIYDEPRAVIARLGDAGGPAAGARARLLLRRGRRPGLPGRREGQAGERGARRGTGGDRRGSGRHGLSVLPVRCCATRWPRPRRPRRSCSTSRRSRHKPSGETMLQKSNGGAFLIEDLAPEGIFTAEDLGEEHLRHRPHRGRVLGAGCGAASRSDPAPGAGRGSGGATQSRRSSASPASPSRRSSAAWRWI